MNAPWLTAAGWLPLMHALLHTLWQGALAAGGLFLALRLVPARRAGLRYGLSAGALAFVLILGMAALAWPDAAPTGGTRPASGSAGNAPAVLPPRAPAAPAGVGSTPAPAAGTAPAASGRSASARARVQAEEHGGLEAPRPGGGSGPEMEKRWVRRAAAFWLLGVAACLFRALRGAVGAERLRGRCVALADPRLLALAEELRSRLRLSRRVRWLVSEEIAVPAVMGIFWPAVLLPAAMLTGVPPDQLRAILAHELAHIQRWDYLVNFGQMLVEAMLFFNPFVWWISHRMRVEREACCDQLAAGECRSPACYVEALVAVIEHGRGTFAGAGAAAPLLAASGPGGDEGSAVERARRLLVPGYRPALRLRWFSLLLVLGLSGLVLSGLWLGTRAVAQTIKPAVAATARKTPPDGRIPETLYRCTALMADGSPLGSGKIDAHYFTRYAQGGTLGGGVNVDEHGSIPVWIPTDAASASVAVVKEGCAVSFFGPFGASEIPRLQGWQFKLTRGFDAVIKAVDETGLPIAGARLQPYYPGPPEIVLPEQGTDAAGGALIQHVGEAALNVRIRADGFQADEAAGIHLDPAKPYRWTLKRAESLRGTVTDAATGRPINAARIKLAGVRGPHEETYADPVKAPLLTTSDAQGRFALDSLRADSRYFLFVEADGYGGELLGEVKAGQPELRAALGPALFAAGKIIHANPVALNQERGVIHLGYHQEFKIGDGFFAVGKQWIRKPEDGEADFIIGPFYHEALQIGVGNRSVVLKAGEMPKLDLLLDLAPDPDPALPDAPAENSRAETRDIIFSLRTPAGGPPPSGSIRVRYVAPEPGMDGRAPTREEDLPVRDGLVRLTVAAPSRITYEPVGLAGCQFPAHYEEEVAAGGAPLEILLDLEPAGTVLGDVAEADGKPAQGFVVYASGAGVESADPRNDGERVRCASPAVGTAGGSFAASPLSFDKNVNLIVAQGDRFTTSVALRLQASAPIRRVKLVIPKGRSVNGRMLNEDGTPAAGVEFRLAYAEWSAGDLLPSTELHRTDEAGRFTLDGVNFPPGVFPFIFVDSKAHYLPLSQRIEDVQAFIEIRLREGRTLSGVIRDPKTGYPIADLPVYAAYHKEDDWRAVTYPTWGAATVGVTHFVAEGRTDAEGRFRFSNLPDAEVQICTVGARWVEPAQAIASPGNTAPLRLEAALLPGSSARIVPPR